MIFRVDRIRSCLDGKTSRSALTEAERRRLEELESVIEGSLHFVRRASAPDVTVSVMERVRGLEADTLDVRESNAAVAKSDRPAGLLDALEDAFAWIWVPRSIRIRPAWALAGLGVLALGLGAMRGPVADGSDDRVSSEAIGAPGAAVVEATVSRESIASAKTVLYVRFELEAPEASSVNLTGSFTDWQPGYHLTETRPGHWTALVPLGPGVHDYAFVVDEERWIADPHAIPVDDGFGGINSRVALVVPESSDAHRGRSS